MCWAASGFVLREPRVASSARLAKAKKKKKEKKPKFNLNEWAANLVVMPYDSTPLRKLVEVAAATYGARCGRPLVASPTNVPKDVWAAPQAILVVNEATVLYANAAACEAFNTTHDALINTTTTLPSDIPKPFESGYEKKVGDVFVKDARRWTISQMEIVDGSLVETMVGVGYAFPKWIVGDFLCEPGGVRQEIISAADLEARVDEQANFVRNLKEVQGKTNKDPAVVEAVAELLRLKGLAAAGGGG